MARHAWVCVSRDWEDDGEGEGLYSTPTLTHTHTPPPLLAVFGVHCSVALLLCCSLFAADVDGACRLVAGSNNYKQLQPLLPTLLPAKKNSNSNNSGDQKSRTMTANSKRQAARSGQKSSCKLKCAAIVCLGKRQSESVSLVNQQQQEQQGADWCVRTLAKIFSISQDGKLEILLKVALNGARCSGDTYMHRFALRTFDIWFDDTFLNHARLIIYIYIYFTIYIL